MYKKVETGVDSEKVFAELKKRVQNEPFARLMKIKLLEVKAGYALTEMVFREEMGNIYSQAHGGAIFSLIDEAFQIASNSHGTVAVALNLNITYVAAPTPGAVLRAEAKEISRTRRTASYQITVSEADGRLIAISQTIAYRKDNPIPLSD